MGKLTRAWARRAVVLAVASLAASGAAAQPLDYRTYVNATYGTSIAYPAGLFRRDDRLAESDHFVRFVGRDGAANFGVSNLASEKPVALTDVYADAVESIKQDGGDITFERRDRDWFVLNGFFKDAVFYRKVVLGKSGTLVGMFQLNYPRAEQDRFRPIQAEMSRSFQPVRRP